MQAGYSSDYTRFLVAGGAPGEMVKVTGEAVNEAGVTGRLFEHGTSRERLPVLQDGQGARSPAEKVTENDDFIAIKDIYPKAPVHVLVIPRKHIDWLNDIGEPDAGFCKGMLEFIVERGRKARGKETAATA